MNKDEKLIIIEKYDEFFEYTYPIIQSIPRKHGIFKRMLLELIINLDEYIYKVVKSNQVSKLYELDIKLDVLRHRLRQCTHNKRRFITDEQHLKISLKLNIVGKIIGAMIANNKGR
ncbi:hypothetical protein [Aliarcobacter butzleri]|uniref:hypothetical protein n=1 Tax=Aliarcobacter butzleri TaxID=28197 RepID=UPI001586F9A9|nr:hypothetical protein [Aliarcobacter butzleri]NUW28998.1 hypothetical protein [Aliarcobacter butzleri]